MLAQWVIVGFCILLSAICLPIRKLRFVRKDRLQASYNEDELKRPVFIVWYRNILELHRGDWLLL